MRPGRTLGLAVALAACTAALAGSPSAHAATHRVVVSVGHNAGADGAPLRYAEEDAGKFADVMIDLGDVSPSALFLVQGKGADGVRGALDQAAASVAHARTSPDDRVVLIFFFSGHSDGQSIELGHDRLTYKDLRGWLASTGADVRIAIIDSCKSGALLQAKGGARGPAFDITLTDDLLASGDAFLTSAAADEDALESSEVRGSFFTHHLVSGLRGAADASGDGVVTLQEAYDYAFNHTVASSAQTGGTPQHPTYDYRVAGRGELRLTEVTRRSSVLEVPADVQRALIIQPLRDQVIAELAGGSVRRIAVAPGEYSVRLWRAGQQSYGRVKIAAGQVASVTWDQLKPIDPPATVAHKGGRSEEPTVVEPALPPAAQAEWDRQSLNVDEWDRVYLGRLSARIDQRAALVLMHRPDLVKAYDDNRAIKYWMIGGGAAVIAASILVAELTLNDCGQTLLRNPAGDPSCLSNSATVGVVATIFVAGGAALGIAGIARHGDVVRGRELQALVDEHNRLLRARLLAAPPGDVQPALPVPVPVKASFDVTPWLRGGDHGAGGLAVVGRF